MESIGLSEVGNAILITLGLMVAFITVVGLSMWGTYAFFKNKNETTEENNHKNDEA